MEVLRPAASARLEMPRVYTWREICLFCGTPRSDALPSCRCSRGVVPGHRRSTLTRSAKHLVQTRPSPSHAVTGDALAMEHAVTRRRSWTGLVDQIRGTPVGSAPPRLRGRLALFTVACAGVAAALIAALLF